MAYRDFGKPGWCLLAKEPTLGQTETQERMGKNWKQANIREYGSFCLVVPDHSLTSYMDPCVLQQALFVCVYLAHRT